MSLIWRLRFLYYGALSFVLAVVISHNKSFELLVSGFFFDRYANAFSKPFAIQLIYNYFTIIIVLVFLLLILKIIYSKNKNRTIQAIVTILLNLSLVEIIKATIYRTRPYDLKEFGGIYDYLSISFAKYSADSFGFSSFPSGHAAAGFSLVALVFLWPKGIKFYLVLFLSLLYGAILGFVRIYQGGHFLSDVIGSFSIASISVATVQWLSIYSNLYYKIVSFITPYLTKIPKFIYLLLLTLLVVLTIFYYYTVNFITYDKTFTLNKIAEDTAIINIPADFSYEIYDVLSLPQLRFLISCNGNYDAKLNPGYTTDVSGNSWILNIGFNYSGICRNINRKVFISLPKDYVINKKFKINMMK